MSVTIAIPVPGEMGAALGARLVAAGLPVLTSLQGRSAASCRRAEKAGMTAASDEDIVAADIILSVVPPANARDLADRFARVCRAEGTSPVYADLNAIRPELAEEIGELVEAGGARFVDGGIIGLPPGPQGKGPVLYVSGPAAGVLQVLTEHTVRVSVMDAPVGAASALKMCYGGITKGLIAVATTMLLAGGRAGVSDALVAELAASQPNLLASLQKSIPDMVPKSARWVPEMQQIESFVGNAYPEHAIFTGAAGLYRQISEQKEPTAFELKDVLALLKTTEIVADRST